MKIGPKTTPQEIKTYAQAVGFIAFWIEKHNADLGQPTSEILQEFDANVCAVLVGDVEGTG